MAFKSQLKYGERTYMLILVSPTIVYRINGCLNVSKGEWEQADSLEEWERLFGEKSSLSDNA